MLGQASVPLARRRQISSAAVAGCGRSLTFCSAPQCLNLKEPSAVVLSWPRPGGGCAPCACLRWQLGTSPSSAHIYSSGASHTHSGAPAGCSGGGGRGPLDVPSAHGAVTPVPSRAAAVAGPVRCGPMQRGFVWSGQPVAPGALLVGRCWTCMRWCVPVCAARCLPRRGDFLLHPTPYLCSCCRPRRRHPSQP